MKNAWLSLAFFGMSLCVSAQETTGISADSIAAPEIVLDEVLVSAVRVNREIPLTFSNLHKEVFHRFGSEWLQADEFKGAQ
jgi:iron complex outermembrane receptor protein